MTKVLIAEDEIITAMAMKNDLEDMGYEVCSFATSGQKAIQIAENEHPNVILMDVKFGGGMDGIEAASEIRSRFDIPSIYMSGYTWENIKESFEVTEPFEYIPKPVEAIDMKNAIELVLQKKK
jgi:CheY-like chemotaxis protein